MDPAALQAYENPFQLLEEWLEEARNTPSIHEPTAMVLATASAQGRPNSRVVLLKELRPGELVFFTNYQSQKAKELEENPHAAATFYWDPLKKQVQVRGSVKRIPRRESEAYWQTRPRESQISQYLSRQSQPLPANTTLEDLAKKTREQWHNHNIPCPQDWGGYLLTPETMEFWIRGEHRLHTRIMFQKQPDLRWTSHQLFP